MNHASQDRPTPGRPSPVADALRPPVIDSPDAAARRCVTSS